jgi:Flp pilus assembly protein TadD
LNHGYALLETGQPQAAHDAFERALSLQRPEDRFAHEAYFLQGRALQALAQHESALACYRQALAAQPAFEEPLQEAVRLLLALGRAEEALELTQSAAASVPSVTPTMLSAQALHALGRRDEALGLVEGVLTKEPAHIGALEARGNLLLEIDRGDEALAAFEHLLQVHGPLPQTLANLAVAHLHRGDPRAALQATEQGAREYPEHPELQLNRAIAHMLVGDWQAGWPAFEWRWAAWTGAAAPWQQRPRWDGRAGLTGQSILLFAEQGLGDTIQFARYVPLVAAQAREVVLVVQRPLVPLFGHLPANCRVVAAGEPVPATDWQCPLLSLPLAFGTTPQTVPPPLPGLRADPGLVARWRQQLAPGVRRVGIAWSGNAQHKNDRHRSIPLALFRSIAAQGWQFVSLQPEVRPADRDVLQSWSGIVDLDPQLRDFRDTAAVLECLDLVVTVDTSVAHLAGTLGLPVWILLPRNPDWRWLMDRSDTPWYPGARLYRQADTGAWMPVLEQVRRDLAAALGPQ